MTQFRQQAKKKITVFALLCFLLSFVEAAYSQQNVEHCLQATELTHHLMASADVAMASQTAIAITGELAADECEPQAEQSCCSGVVAITSNPTQGLAEKVYVQPASLLNLRLRANPSSLFRPPKS